MYYIIFFCILVYIKMPIYVSNMLLVLFCKKNLTDGHTDRRAD